MPLYAITHQFESDGGNIQYRTIQEVEKDAETSDIDLTIVTTGLALDDETVDGIALVELADSVEPEAVFESAATIQRTDGRATLGSDESAVTSEPDGPDPAHDIQQFEADAEVANSLEAVGHTPGRGVLFDANLTRCHPFHRDRWFVPIGGTVLADTAVTPADVVSFYRAHLDRFAEQPSLTVAVYHRQSDSLIQLALVASRAEKAAATELARADTTGRPMNFSRFELSKRSLVVGETTHGPGTADAVFRTEGEDRVTSRELAYRHWFEGVPVSYHPLGVMVDGDLYRPVIPDGDRSWSAVGDPIPVATYRGSPTSRPWQFGMTRSGDQLLLTQARASPAKFDPVLKRFPIETQTIGDDPIVFNHTVSRRVWSEDPLNIRVQSQRTEGLRTQFVYADGDGWHLIQPKALSDQPETTESSFESTQLDGVSVRSSLLRAEADGETKATVEHEYRIDTRVLDACDSLYALSYYEANEESLDNLQWEIADATAYEIVRENSPQ
jgi:hypothetical protein